MTYTGRAPQRPSRWALYHPSSGLCCAKTRQQQNARNREVMEEGRSSLCDFPECAVATAQVMPYALRKMALECESQAKRESLTLVISPSARQSGEFVRK